MSTSCLGVIARAHFCPRYKHQYELARVIWLLIAFFLIAAFVFGCWLEVVVEMLIEDMPMVNQYPKRGTDISFLSLWLEVSASSWPRAARRSKAHQLFADAHSTTSAAQPYILSALRFHAYLDPSAYLYNKIVILPFLPQRFIPKWITSQTNERTRKHTFLLLQQKKKKKNQGKMYEHKQNFFFLHRMLFIIFYAHIQH